MGILISTSNEYPQHIFSWRNKKDIIWIHLLSEAVDIEAEVVKTMKFWISALKSNLGNMVNVLKFRTLYSLLFWPKFYFLRTCYLKYLVELQTV